LRGSEKAKEASTKGVKIMANLLSGLEKFGLGNLQEAKIYEEPEKKEAKKGDEAPKVVSEEEYLFDKTYNCPLCSTEFKDRAVRSGKARQIGSDLDLRPKFEHFDPGKYNVASCPNCGYTCLTTPNYFVNLPAAQAGLVKANISDAFIKRTEFPAVFTYEYAFERYQLCLANAIVKKARDSEKAAICLRTAWLLRGMGENLDKTAADYKEKFAEIKGQEMEYLENAYEGFITAASHESFPLAGMDEMTIDYLLAALAIEFKKTDVASRMISKILASPDANNRIKDKARDLKDMLAASKKA
jgi:uncharacterized protein (DUF2225 family)